MTRAARGAGYPRRPRVSVARFQENVNQWTLTKSALWPETNAR